MPSSENREEMLFALALEKPAKLRTAFLDAVCADNPALPSSHIANKHGGKPPPNDWPFTAQTGKSPFGT